MDELSASQQGISSSIALTVIGFSQQIQQETRCMSVSGGLMPQEILSSSAPEYDWIEGNGSA